MLNRFTLALVCALTFFPVFSAAQDCAPPAIVANAKSENIFSPEQEMIFGDLTVENMSGDIRLVRDEQLEAFVNGIGERLVKHLPPIGLKYKFHIVDIPEANAFNIPGGHVFLSRKLIAFVSNEDELAGVMAHELGHATVRHGAVDMSVMMKKILNVTSLGDRKDIAEKYNLLIENARTKRVSRKSGHENEQQLEADKIGLFAMVAAGYDPTAFTSFFDRLTENEGKTGSWFSDLFGNTRPEQKRMRELIRTTELLPNTCREGRSAKASEDFLKWQADVVSFRPTSRKEELPGLVWKKELSPKLRSDVTHLTFSADGKYLLAQDDYGITIIERDPVQVSFQIPAEEANKASFTPDGKFVVFTTESLRFEKWSIADKKPVEVRELVLRRDCWEHQLSPDGNYLACVDTTPNVNIIETKTGKKVWEKKQFYELDAFEYFFWLFRSREDEDSADDANFFRILFSPDSKFVMISRTDKYRYRFKIDGLQVAGSENTALAVDLAMLKPVDIGGDLKKISSRPYAFLDSGRILGMPSVKLEDAGIFSFPGGKRMQKFAFAAQNIKLTSNPEYVIIKPLSNGMMGFFNLKNASVASAMNKPDAALWNNIIAFESASGKIMIREVTYNEAEKRFTDKDIATIDVPVSSLGGLNSASVSNNLKWLALSSKTRGGLWNLETGERKVFVRGFRGVIAGEDGGAVGAFPKLGETPNSLVLMNGNNSQVDAIRELPEKGARQYGRFVLIRSSLKAKKEEKKDEKKQEAGFSMKEPDESDLRQEVKFELKDFVQDKVIWSRDFPKQSPRYSFDEASGRLIFYWRLDTEIGKAKLKETPELQAKADALGDKDSDYLVEVIDAFTQKTVGNILLETGKGSFGVGSGLSERNWLVLRDSEGRVLVYSLADGSLKHRFFGKNAAINPGKDQLAVENFPGEIALYNLANGERAANFVFNGKAAVVQFNLAGDKLFVLSDSQAAYAFDIGKLVAKPKSQLN